MGYLRLGREIIQMSKKIVDVSAYWAAWCSYKLGHHDSKGGKTDAACLTYMEVSHHRTWHQFGVWSA
jgi:hypothetical protein